MIQSQAAENFPADGNQEEYMSETVTGYIDHVIFRNEDNGYTVIVLKDTKE